MDANRKPYLYAFADVPADRYTYPVGDGDQYGYICADCDGNLYCNGNPDKLTGTSANVNRDGDRHMDANRITVIYPNARANPEPYSNGGRAVSHTYGVDADADTTTHAGSNVYAVRLKLARQRAIAASDERRAGA